MQQKFLLELQGKLAGRFFDFEGSPSSVSIHQGMGAHDRLIAQSGSPKEMVLVCGTGMSRSFYDWIGSTLASSSGPRKNGAVIALDGHSQKARITFNNALITSLELPELRATSKNDAVMTVKIQPEAAKFQADGGKLDLGPYHAAVPKSWTIGHFRLRIHGLDRECQHVTRVGPLNFSQKLTPDYSGSARNPAWIEPTGLNFPKLIIEIPDKYVDGFMKWHHNSIAGKNANNQEKNGALDFLGPGSSTAYFGVSFKGLGIVQLSMTKGGGPVTIELYSNGMTFSAGAAATK